MAIWQKTGSTDIALDGSGDVVDCAYCPCDTCSPYQASSLFMTYSGFTDSGDPDYTEIVSPNGTYECIWDGAHWTGTPVLLGTYVSFGDTYEYWLSPAARCIGTDPATFNSFGSGATLGYNYADMVIGGSSPGVGSVDFYNAGTLSIST